MSNVSVQVSVQEYTVEGRENVLVFVLILYIKHTAVGMREVVE